MRPVIANAPFLRSDTKQRVKRNEKIYDIDAGYAETLVLNGLCRWGADQPVPETKANPTPPTGTQSSASPAGQASPSKTAKRSKRGESKAQTEQ